MKASVLSNERFSTNLNFCKFKMKFILLRFAIILLGCAIATRAAEEKNYKFILDEVFAEKESEDVGKIKVELVKSEEGVVINGQAEQLVDLDNEWKVKDNILLQICAVSQTHINRLPLLTPYR